MSLEGESSMAWDTHRGFTIKVLLHTSMHYLDNQGIRFWGSIALSPFSTATIPLHSTTAKAHNPSRL